jgi:hypothetical protein
MAPLMRRYLHYDWHWDWLTGNGDLGNMGIHYLDACRMAIGADKLPRRVMSIGGRFAYDDDGETPNTQIMLFDYKPAPIIFEVRGLPKDKSFLDAKWNKFMDTYMGVRIGVIVHCQAGYLAGNTAYDKSGRAIKKFEPTNEDLRANFITAVRSRKSSDLNNDILDGHTSAGLVHMANISHRLGRKASPDEIKEIAGSNKDFAESYDRFGEHLAANGVDLKKTRPTLGPILLMDPKTETFKGPLADSANKLLTRNYRKPWIVPENV